jgi:hypothetical protein
LFWGLEHALPFIGKRAALPVAALPLLAALTLPQHCVTIIDDAVEDHRSYAIWLGNPVELKLHTLPHGRGGQLPSRVRP